MFLRSFFRRSSASSQARVSQVNIMTQATHAVRKAAMLAARRGVYRLRFFGSLADGYHLGAERTSGASVVVFGPKFTTVTQATEWGQAHVGRMAQRLYRNVRETREPVAAPAAA